MTDELTQWFNCLAVSFVTMFLCRLRALNVDICHGSLLIIEKAGSNKHLTAIDPHSWVGSPKHRDIDLSIADYEGHEYLPVIHDRVISPDSWIVRPPLKESDVIRVIRDFRGLPKGRYLLYYHRARREFAFSDLEGGAEATCSPPTKTLLSGYSDPDLLAKSILHLHLFASENRESLAGFSQREAWGRLSGWRVSAADELRSILPSSFQ